MNNRYGLSWTPMNAHNCRCTPVAYWREELCLPQLSARHTASRIPVRQRFVRGHAKASPRYPPYPN